MVRLAGKVALISVRGRRRPLGDRPRRGGLRGRLRQAQKSLRQEPDGKPKGFSFGRSRTMGFRILAKVRNRRGTAVVNSLPVHPDRPRSGLRGVLVCICCRRGAAVGYASGSRRGSSVACRSQLEVIPSNATGRRNLPRARNNHSREAEPEEESSKASVDTSNPAKRGRSKTGHRDGRSSGGGPRLVPLSSDLEPFATSCPVHCLAPPPGHDGSSSWQAGERIRRHGCRGADSRLRPPIMKDDVLALDTAALGQTPTKFLDESGLQGTGDQLLAPYAEHATSASCALPWRKLGARVSGSHLPTLRIRLVVVRPS